MRQSISCTPSVNIYSGWAVRPELENTRDEPTIRTRRNIVKAGLVQYHECHLHNPELRTPCFIPLPSISYLEQGQQDNLPSKKDNTDLVRKGKEIVVE